MRAPSHARAQSLAAVGAHWERANRLGRAFVCFRKAGDEARVRGDRGAIELYEHCITLAAEVEGNELISVLQVAGLRVELACALERFSYHSKALKHVSLALSLMGETLPTTDNSMLFEIATKIILPELPRALCSCCFSSVHGGSSNAEASFMASRGRTTTSVR